MIFETMDVTCKLQRVNEPTTIISSKLGLDFNKFIALTLTLGADFSAPALVSLLFAITLLICLIITLACVFVAFPNLVKV